MPLSPLKTNASLTATNGELNDRIPVTEGTAAAYEQRQGPCCLTKAGLSKRRESVEQPAVDLPHCRLRPLERPGARHKVYDA